MTTPAGASWEVIALHTAPLYDRRLDPIRYGRRRQVLLARADSWPGAWQHVATLLADPGAALGALPFNLLTHITWSVD